MSFLDCLNKSKISVEKKKKAEEIYRQQYDEGLKQGLSESDADLRAASQTADALETLAAVDKKRKVKAIKAQQRLFQNVESYTGDDIYSAALAVFERSGDDVGKSRYASIVDKEKVIKGSAHARMNQFLKEYQPKMVGLVRPKTGMGNVVKELFGISSGNESAKEIAEGIMQSFEYLRKRANRAGANIGKKETYGLPQQHDRVKVSKTDKETWVNKIYNKLNWETMKDPNTGLSIPELKRQSVLMEVYDTIITDGRSKLKAGEAKRMGALDKRLANHRFLEFKSPEDWLAYHEEFGVGDIFSVVNSHIDRMSRDIALMETFGPNPNVGKEALKNYVNVKAAERDVKFKGDRKFLETQKAEATDRKIDDLYTVYANTNSPDSGNTFALTMAGIRNILTSAYLGSASLAAVTGDMFTKALTKKFNKLPGTVSLKQYLKLMNPADKKNQQIAIRSGLIAESATSMSYGQSRFMGEVLGPQWTQRTSDTVLRASLLTPHTQSMRWAFGMEFLGALADRSKVSFNDLEFKQTFENYGITAEDWNLLRSTKLADEEGALFLRPEDLRVRTDIDENLAESVADKFMEMIFAEMEYAVPSSSLKARVALGGATRAGTVAGEIARSFSMFKNFPVTVINTHIMRGISQQGTTNKLKYIAAFGIGMTLMGALNLQLRQFSQGKDFMNMDLSSENGLKFWGAAALAGGGLAIWGDFLFSDVNKYGGGIETTIAGPVAGFAGDTLKLTTGNLIELAQGKETNFSRELVNFASRNMPGSNLWYARQVLRREIFDQLLLQVDPEAEKRFKRMERKLMRDTGQEYYWRPGQSMFGDNDIKAPKIAPSLPD